MKKYYKVEIFTINSLKNVRKYISEILMFKKSKVDELNQKWQILTENISEFDYLTYRIRNSFNDMLRCIDSAIDTGEESDVLNFLKEQQIPSNLVTYAISNEPKGLDNEVVYFFSHFINQSYDKYYNNSIIIDAINLLVENLEPDQCSSYNKFVINLTEYLIKHQETLENFIKDSNSPLLFSYFGAFVEFYNECVPFMAFASSNSSINELLSNNPKFFLPLIEEVGRCIDAKEQKKNEFFHSINLSLRVMSESILKSFMKIFHSEILYMKIYSERNNIKMLQNAIYFLIHFDFKNIISNFANRIIYKIDEMLKTDDETILFYALRFSALLLQTCQPCFNEMPINGKIVNSFNCCLPSDYYIKSDVDKQTISVRIASNDLIEYITLEFWHFNYIISSAFDLFANFLDLSERVCVALCELAFELAIQPSKDCAYYTLSSECKNGLYDIIRSACLGIQRRIGNKPLKQKKLDEQYKNIDFECSNDVESQMYRKVIIMLEFLLEMDFVAQTKILND